MKQFCNSQESETRKTLVKQPADTDRPDVVIPSGLSTARQQYLFKEIRQYCREGTEDTVCPQPQLDTSKC